MVTTESDGSSQNTLTASPDHSPTKSLSPLGCSYPFPLVEAPWFLQGPQMAGLPPVRSLLGACQAAWSLSGTLQAIVLQSGPLATPWRGLTACILPLQQGCYLLYTASTLSMPSRVGGEGRGRASSVCKAELTLSGLVWSRYTMPQHLKLKRG